MECVVFFGNENILNPLFLVDFSKLSRTNNRKYFPFNVTVVFFGLFYINMTMYLYYITRLLSFHGFPFTWFIAQFLSYLMRPSDDLKMYIHEKKVSLGLMNKDMPILG